MFWGPEVYAGEFERAEWAFVDVLDLAVVNHDLINLQRVNFLQRLLPAALFNGNFVVDFFLGLLAIDVDLRAVDLQIGHDSPEQDGAPVDARTEKSNVGDRRFGIVILNDGHILQVRGQAYGVKVESADRYRVTLYRRVESRFRSPAQGLVDKKGSYDGDHEKQDEDAGGPRHDPDGF